MHRNFARSGFAPSTIEAQIPVLELEYTKLREKLIADGQKLDL